MNGRHTNATIAQIWGKKNDSNFDGNCTPHLCLSGTYEYITPMYVRSTEFTSLIMVPAWAETRWSGFYTFNCFWQFIGIINLSALVGQYLKHLIHLILTPLLRHCLPLHLLARNLWLPLHWFSRNARLVRPLRYQTIYTQSFIGFYRWFSRC